MIADDLADLDAAYARGEIPTAQWLRRRAEAVEALSPEEREGRPEVVWTQPTLWDDDDAGDR